MHLAKVCSSSSVLFTLMTCVSHTRQVLECVYVSHTRQVLECVCVSHTRQVLECVCMYPTPDRS